MTTKNLTGWFLILGPLTVFLFGFLLTAILIGQGNTPAEAVTEIMANQALTVIFTVIGALGFVAAFIGTVLLLDSMSGDDKPGGVLARIGIIIFIGLTALAMVASMTNMASLAAIQAEATDTVEITASKFSMAVTTQLVGNVIWAGLFFFSGVGFILVGTVLVIQKRLNLIVDWIFVISGSLFVILSVIPLDLAQLIQGIIFGIMVLNMIVGGVVVLKEKQAN